MTEAFRGDSEAIVPAPRLTDRIAQRIRRQIVSGKLREGDHLPPESELINLFKVSRPTVREALRVLESELLITPRRGARTGAEVRAPSTELSARYNSLVLQYRGVTLADVSMARNIIEPPIAADVARNGNADTCERLESMLAVEAQALDEPELATQVTNDFHLELARILGSETLLLTLEQYYWLIDKQGKKIEMATDAARYSKRIRRVHREHIKLLEFIRVRDADSAEKHWRRHMQEVSDVITHHDSDGSMNVIDLLE